MAVPHSPESLLCRASELLRRLATVFLRPYGLALAPGGGCRGVPRHGHNHTKVPDEGLASATRTPNLRPDT